MGRVGALSHLSNDSLIRLFDLILCGSSWVSLAASELDVSLTVGWSPRGFDQ